MVRFSTPSQSSTALLISTSMPLTFLVLGSRIECGAIAEFAEHDALLAHPVERAVGAVLEHRLGLLVELLRLGGDAGRRADECGEQTGETDGK